MEHIPHFSILIDCEQNIVTIESIEYTVLTHIGVWVKTNTIKNTPFIISMHVMFLKQ